MRARSSASSSSATSDIDGSAPVRRVAAATWVRVALGQIAFQLVVVMLGFLCFAALFRMGVFRQVDILFYRGLVLLGIAFAATLILAVALAARMRWLGVVGSAVAGAGALSLALNLSFFVLGPVTVDRSLSVFMLGTMAANPERSFTEAEMGARFADLYVGEWHQLERRFGEQVASGNVARSGRGYRITPQGQGFVALSRRIAWLFEADPRLVEAGQASGHPLQAAEAVPQP